MGVYVFIHNIYIHTYMDMYTLCICVCIRPPFGCGAGVEGGDWGPCTRDTGSYIYMSMYMYYVLCTMYYVLCTML